jgi:hypothetical protein
VVGRLAVLLGTEECRDLGVGERSTRGNSTWSLSAESTTGVMFGAEADEELDVDESFDDSVRSDRDLTQALKAM